jgi:hypothetical protein
MTQTEYQMEEKIKRWNMLAIGVFVVLCVVAFRCLQVKGALYTYLGIGDFLILALAIFRVIRLLAYDNITLFLREAFLDVKTLSFVEGGEEFVERVPSENSLKRTISKLLNCPWCLGVWVALLGLYLYLTYPALWILFALLALSAIASLFQVAANLLGWRAEKAKLKTQKLMQE